MNRAGKGIERPIPARVIDDVLGGIFKYSGKIACCTPLENRPDAVFDHFSIQRAEFVKCFVALHFGPGFGFA